jgi:hypothetical protein
MRRFWRTVRSMGTKGSGLLDFARAMLAGWFTRMSGPLSVPAAALALWVDNNAAKYLFGVTAFVCLWATAYLVWKAEHDKVIQLKKRRSRTTAKLQEFYASAAPIIERSLSKEISKTDFNKYIEEAQTWTTNCKNWIDQNMGSPAKARFLDRTDMLLTSVPGAVNEEHINIVRNLTRWSQNLLILIESGGVWDKAENG